MSHRPTIIASTIRQIVARRALSVPMDIATVVSITDVTMNADNSVARVTVGALTGKEKAVNYLSEHEGEIRSDIASHLRTFGIPKLKFVVDDRSLRLSRIDELLQTKTAKENGKKEGHNETAS